MTKPSIPIKCVIVGDKGVGKTCLFLACTNTWPPDYHIPKACGAHLSSVIVDNKSVNLSLWDSCHPNYDRTLSFPETDVFLLCYASRRNLTNIKERWISQISYHCPGAPFFLVGTRSDIIDDEILMELGLEQKWDPPISRREGNKIADQLGTHKHMACSPQIGRASCRERVLMPV